MIRVNDIVIFKNSTIRTPFLVLRDKSNTEKELYRLKSMNSGKFLPVIITRSMLDGYLKIDKSRNTKLYKLLNIK